MHLLNRRTVNLLGFAICAGLMGYALYLQHYVGLDPCPLCVLQRMAVIGLGVLFLLAGLHHPATMGARIYGALMVLGGSRCYGCGPSCVVAAFAGG